MAILFVGGGGGQVVGHERMGTWRLYMIGFTEGYHRD